MKIVLRKNSEAVSVGPAERTDLHAARADSWLAVQDRHIPTGFRDANFSPTMQSVLAVSKSLINVSLVMTIALSSALEVQQTTTAKNARILLMPRRVVAGDRATLAVLDVNGRLTPGVTVAFSNGDRVTTNSTGRGLFVAPLTEGLLFATIQGRPGRVQTQVTPPTPGKNATLVEQSPHFASLSDRFELQGRGFCGDADRNVVQVNGRDALVLAASSESLTVLPPEDLEAGPGDITVACGKSQPSVARSTFLSLTLEADRSAMKAGEKRTLTVRVGGTQERVLLEARNLAPDVAELAGGNPAKSISSGSRENLAVFTLIGRKRGNILVSIRLMPGAVPAKP